MRNKLIYLGSMLFVVTLLFTFFMISAGLHSKAGIITDPIEKILYFEDPINGNPIGIPEGQEMSLFEIGANPYYLSPTSGGWKSAQFDFVFHTGEPVDIRVYLDIVGGTDALLYTHSNLNNDFYPANVSSYNQGKIYFTIYNDNEIFNNTTDYVRINWIIRNY